LKSFDEVLSRMFTEGGLVFGRLSGPSRSASADAPVRIDIKPIVVKGEGRFQFAYQHGPKVTHVNLAAEAAEAELRSQSTLFRQCILRDATSEATVRFGKSGEPELRVKSLAGSKPIELTHDRVKHRILPEGEPVNFLISLGVMTADGRVIAAKYAKFRQINRFLEMVDDVAGSLDEEKLLRIVDFGSGKSYLTFALHHYFTVIRKREVSITGLDLKQDVVAQCNAIATELGCTRLKFEQGDIADYTPADAEKVDMVVSLHACDTATDDAIAKAVSWGASVILAVPCCQHELFGQIKSSANRPLLKHGILKERLAALITDALRAEWLETRGYATQVMEFIETEHTPKNLLIRAVRRDGKPKASKAEYEAFRDLWQANPRIDAVFPASVPG
jgi:SAM-dependent methyltransferase